MIARVLKEIAVFRAAGAGGFTGATAETTVDMAYWAIVDRQASILYGAHQVDASAGRIVFIARLKISRARRETQSAVDTGERLVFVNKPVSSVAHSAGNFPFGSNNSLIRFSSTEGIRFGCSSKRGTYTTPFPARATNVCGAES